jgi:tRNA-2-methylthio-N6-dimethylallyladenosine synthase
MVDRYRRHPNLCDYLHLPVQSGSDRVLRRMGRGYEIALYDDLVARLRQARPSLALSTDLIVGFPGETEADFAATLALVERTRFAALFAFCYSPRPGTAAPRLDGAVPREVAEERLQRLLALQNSIQSEINRQLLDREMEVLVTGPGKQAGQFVGRTSCNRIVHFETPGAGSATAGERVLVRIVRTLPHSLLGASIRPVGGARGSAGATAASAKGSGRPRLPVLGAGEPVSN